MTLQRLTHTAPSKEAVLRVYNGKVVLNACASRLLGLNPGDLVNVTYDREHFQASGDKRLYIGKVKRNAYEVTRRAESYYICSTALSKSIADALQGFGSYRICPEDYTTGLDGEKYYNIFFKKYD